MCVFPDEGEDISSDQDDLIEELQDIGYIITPELPKTVIGLDDDVFKPIITKHKGQKE